MKNTSLILLLFLLALSCSDPASHERAPETALVAVDFDKTDSIELYRFPDPNRQGVFDRVNTSDTQLIKLLVGNLKEESIECAVCPHYEKILLFSNKEVFKTIYVSDSCNYVAFSINGKQIFKPFEKKLKEKLSRAFETVDATKR